MGNLTNGIHDFAVQTDATDDNYPVEGAATRTAIYKNSSESTNNLHTSAGRDMPAAESPANDAHGITHA